MRPGQVFSRPRATADEAIAASGGHCAERSASCRRRYRILKTIEIADMPIAYLPGNCTNSRPRPRHCRDSTDRVQPRVASAGKRSSLPSFATESAATKQPGVSFLGPGLLRLSRAIHLEEVYPNFARAVGTHRSLVRDVSLAGPPRHHGRGRDGHGPETGSRRGSPGSAPCSLGRRVWIDPLAPERVVGSVGPKWPAWIGPEYEFPERLEILNWALLGRNNERPCSARRRSATPCWRTLAPRLMKLRMSAISRSRPRAGPSSLGPHPLRSRISCLRLDPTTMPERHCSAADHLPFPSRSPREFAIRRASTPTPHRAAAHEMELGLRFPPCLAPLGRDAAHVPA